MKPYANTFGEILRDVAAINSQALTNKAELAASLARHYPYRRSELRRIECAAQTQLKAIRGLSLGTAAAWD
jgi:hypothetical protein